jgi:hypothetical protein
MEAVQIIEFTENLKDHFKKLNFEWLEKFFSVLPSDEQVLTNPMESDRVMLYSNTDLKIAVNMYAKYGFRVIPKTDFHNERANIKMEMKLK